MHSIVTGEARLGAQQLRKAGLKVTVPRLKILEILNQVEIEHLTAEGVYRALLKGEEDVGLATVYRVLTQFEAAGLVRKLNFEGGQAVFELERGKHHDHLVCVKCGKVTEFFDEEIEARQQLVAETNGYELADHALVLYGVCKECQQGG